MFRNNLLAITLFILAFLILSQNVSAQTNDMMEDYQPPPLFGAPKLPPPKVKKPKVDVIPDISRQVEQPEKNKNAPVKAVKPPRIIKEVQEVQAIQETAPSSVKTKPVLREAIKPSSKPMIENTREAPKTELKPPAEPQKIETKKPASSKQPDVRDLKQTEEPINFLKKQAPQKQQEPIIPKSQGVVKGPKTMPSYKKKSVETEQTFISQTPSAPMLQRAQKNIVKETTATKSNVEPAPQPSTISKDQNKFMLLYQAGQTQPSDTDFSATLKPMAQLLNQNDKIIEIKSYASMINGKINSDRRTALDRGLSIREYLLSEGVEPFRINLRSFGSQSEKPQKDWVEITLVE